MSESVDVKRVAILRAYDRLKGRVGSGRWRLLIEKTQPHADAKDVCVYGQYLSSEGVHQNALRGFGSNSR